ncbi:MAG: IS3 family transposase [Methylococcales bacterium]|nr:hypothetical protein [Methylococcaceae bacterium]
MVFAQKKRLQQEFNALDCVLLKLLDEEYTRHPFYGFLRMTKYLHGCGHMVNRKRVTTLNTNRAQVRTLGLAGMPLYWMMREKLAG